MTRRRHPELFAALVVCAVLIPRVSASADLRGLDKQTGCRFELPAAWTFSGFKWTGGCTSDHKADGLGVLRGQRGGTVAESFFGEIKEGRLVLGVLERPDGFVAGRFNNGKPTHDPERNELIAAFHAAALGAAQASEAFRRGGNLASAKYYSEKSRALENQLD